MSRTSLSAVRAEESLPLDGYRTSGSSPGRSTLHLVGAGRVGRAFLRILSPGDARLVAVSDRTGTVFDPDGLDAAAIADWKEKGNPLAAHPQGTPGAATAALGRVHADVVADATATDFCRPEWAEALDAVVTRGGALALASKDPAAALGYRWLTPGTAGRVGVNAALGGAGAGLRDDLSELRGACVGVALAGSASTTTILEVLERGGSFEEGVAAAGARGLLEADPEQDFIGLDAAVKLAVVARVLWDLDVSVADVATEDLRALDCAALRARARSGRTTRLVARAWRTGDCRVAYEELPLGSPLAVPTDRVAYAFELPGGRARYHLGAGLGPEATAAALLADVQALTPRRLAGPGGAGAARRSGRVDAELGAGVVHLPSDFALESGERLHPAQVAFEARGPRDAPVVLALGGISAHRHAGDADGRRGWWTEQVGPDRALDTLRYRVLSVDFLGGSGETTGPRSAAHWPREAAVSTGDQARAVLAVLDRLGVRALHLAVGASYGGMVALQLARLAPARVRALCVLGAAHEAHPIATAVRSLQRRIVRLGADVGRGPDALAIARGLGMVSYRSAREFGRRFAAAPVGRAPARFEVEEYLEARGRSFADRFHPEAFLCLSESLDLHRVVPEEIHVGGTFVSFDTDALVPPLTVRELVLRLGAPARHVEVATEFGHDAFLKEVAAVARILRDALADGPAARREVAR